MFFLSIAHNKHKYSWRKRGTKVWIVFRLFIPSIYYIGRLDIHVILDRIMWDVYCIIYNYNYVYGKYQYKVLSTKKLFEGKFNWEEKGQVDFG